MSKIRVIPSNMHPWECEINGVPYGPYPAGTVQTVPDEVAAVIDNYYASQPKEAPPEASFEDQVMAVVRAHLSEIIADGSITTAKIADGAATEAKIAADAITSAKFDAGARVPGVAVVTQAPTADNTDGIKIAVLASEPDTFYDGWLYLITGGV